MKTHPMESWIEAYLAEKDVTKGTLDLYRTVLNQYIGYLKTHRIHQAKTNDVMNYSEWKKNQGYSTRWIYNQISVIKGFYQYLKHNQKRLGLPVEYAHDVTESINNVRIKKGLSKPVLTIEQAKHIILTTKDNRKYIWHYRDHALVYLMITTGLRSVEIRRARRKDFRMIDKQPVLYVQGKGERSADDFVKIPPGVEEAIKDYLERRKDKNPYLFVSHSYHTDKPYLSRSFFVRMIKRVLNDCGLEDTGITTHSLRHTAATLNLLRGGSLESTKKLMRHQNLATTLIYAHHIERIHDDSENQVERYILNEEVF